MHLNKQKKQLVVAVSTLLLLLLCAPKPLTPEVILGVVLVANTHYHTIYIDGKDVFYFSSYSESDVKWRVKEFAKLEKN